MHTFPCTPWECSTASRHGTQGVWAGADPRLWLWILAQRARLLVPLLPNWSSSAVASDFLSGLSYGNPSVCTEPLQAVLFVIALPMPPPPFTNLFALSKHFLQALVNNSFAGLKRRPVQPLRREPPPFHPATQYLGREVCRRWHQGTALGRCGGLKSRVLGCVLRRPDAGPMMECA